MVGDKALSREITDREWGAGITNIVTRHDIVPRILLAAWEGGKVAGLGLLLASVRGMQTREQRRQQLQLPAQQDGLRGLVHKARTRTICAVQRDNWLQRCVPAMCLYD